MDEATARMCPREKFVVWSASFPSDVLLSHDLEYANYHKRSSLNQHQFSYLALQEQLLKSKTGLTELKPKTVFLLEILGENLFLCVCSCLEAAHIPWPVAKSPSPTVLLLSHLFWLWPCSLPLWRTFVMIWATCIIQAALPISRSLT